MSKLDDILTKLENTVAQDTAQRLSGNGGRISPKHHHAQKKQQIKDLMRHLIGEPEERATTDMSLQSWTNDDYKMFGKNELRVELWQKIEAL